MRWEINRVATAGTRYYLMRELPVETLGTPLKREASRGMTKTLR